MVAGTIRSSCRQIKPAWDRAIVSHVPGECSPPTPAGGLEGGTKGRRRAPRGVHAQAGGRWAARLPLPPYPPAAPLPGGGYGAPQGEVAPGRRPSSEARAESGRVPLTGPGDSGLRGTRSALWFRLGSRGAPSPGNALSSPSLPRPRPGGEGGGGPTGASPGGAG